MTRQLIPAARPIIGQDERDAVDRVLRSGMIAQGSQVKAFEEEFSRQLSNGLDCIAVNSGTSALHLGLLAAGIGPGDEVIVPSFTFAATANAVALTGAAPVFADIEPRSFCLAAGNAALAITRKTRAIMPVHLYGHPADMPAITRLADEHGLMVFEDAAQAHGASSDGGLVGTFGTFGAFSFYPTKNMTSGEGGMVSCGHSEFARRVRLLRNQGMDRPYTNELVGLNNRMTDIHAAIGRVQLRNLEDWTARRQQNAAYLDAHLEGVRTPPVAPGAVHVYHQYTIRVDGGTAERDRTVTALREEYGIGSGVYYPLPTHRLRPYRSAKSPDLPETDRASAEVISLPIHPSLSSDDLDRIVTAVNSVVKAGN